METGLITTAARGWDPISRTEPGPGSELAEFLLTILSAVAKLERATILVRSAEGRARAKQRGMRLGRKPKLNSTQLVEDQGDARQR